MIVTIIIITFYYHLYFLSPIIITTTHIITIIITLIIIITIIFLIVIAPKNIFLITNISAKTVHCFYEMIILIISRGPPPGVEHYLSIIKRHRLIMVA